MQWLNQRCEQKLQRLRDQGLEREMCVVEAASGRKLQVSGRSFLQFASNDYLGLAANASNAEMDLNTSASASPMVTGYSCWHRQFEQDMARFLKFEQAVYFNSGFSANEGVLQSCISSKDVVFTDRLNHASLIDGVRISRAKSVRYRHLDMEDLEQKIKATFVPVGGKRWIVSDAVFSMDGHIAPLPDLVALSRQYNAALYIDDAHGFGIFGEGRGTLAGFGHCASDVDILMVTCGKSLGTIGACVLSRSPVAEYIRQKSRSYVYSTALPTWVARVSVNRLQQLKGATTQRSHLKQLGLYFRDVAHEQRAHYDFQVKQPDHQLDRFFHPVNPVIVGDVQRVLDLGQWMRSMGILVGTIRPPTVPSGSARLRICLSAVHSREDIETLWQGIASYFYGSHL